MAGLGILFLVRELADIANGKRQYIFLGFSLSAGHILLGIVAWIASRRSGKAYFILGAISLFIGLVGAGVELDNLVYGVSEDRIFAWAIVTFLVVAGVALLVAGKTVGSVMGRRDT